MKCLLILSVLGLPGFNHASNVTTNGVCGHGWQTMGLKCYYFSGQATVSSYAAGEVKCQALHPMAHLVTIHSKQENQWIADRTETYLTYMGATDRTTENVWQWSDNSTWGYTNWDLGQPDDWANDEDCGILHQDGTWRDIPCAGWNVGYVCSYHLEIRQPAELQNEDIKSNKASIEEIRKILNTTQLESREADDLQNGKIKQLRNHVGTVSDRIDTIAESLGKAINQGFSTFDSKLKRLEILVSKVETNVTAVENRIDKDLDALEKSLGNSVAEMKTNVTALENRWKSAKSRLESGSCEESCQTPTVVLCQAQSCSDLKGVRSGRYTIKIGGSDVKVYCDMDKDGGGWTVIQRRGDFGNPSDYFYRNWYDYTNGFGDQNEDHWLGLRYQNLITKAEAQQLLITLEDWDGNSIQYTVNNYKISNEANKFKMDYSTISGPRPGSWSYHKGMKFTTKDQDNDNHGNGYNCAKNYEGGWWYKSCLNSHLNGLYGSRGITNPKYIVWHSWKGWSSLKKSEMKIRPMSYQASGSTSTAACLKCILNL